MTLLVSRRAKYTMDERKCSLIALLYLSHIRAAHSSHFISHIDTGRLPTVYCMNDVRTCAGACARPFSADSQRAPLLKCQHAGRRSTPPLLYVRTCARPPTRRHLSAAACYVSCSVCVWLFALMSVQVKRVNLIR